MKIKKKKSTCFHPNQRIPFEKLIEPAPLKDLGNSRLERNWNADKSNSDENSWDSTINPFIKPIHPNVSKHLTARIRDFLQAENDAIERRKGISIFPTKQRYKRKAAINRDSLSTAEWNDDLVLIVIGQFLRECCLFGQGEAGVWKNIGWLQLGEKHLGFWKRQVVKWE